jgi:RHS repeat-associated protein
MVAYHPDHLGSTALITDGAGNVLENRAYSPFGETTPSSNTAYLFTGQEYDRESGLHYFRARYYEPKAGRFLAYDPALVGNKEGGSFKRALATSQALNGYSYVENRPSLATDPTGREAELRAATGPTYCYGCLERAYYEDVTVGSIQKTDHVEQAVIFVATMGVSRIVSGAYRAYTIEARAAGETLDFSAFGKVVTKYTELEHPIMFGQPNVSPTFSAGGSQKGASIFEVAGRLRSGELSTDNIPVQYIWHNGERIAVNNRSLTTLSLAGKTPTNAIDMTGKLPLAGPDAQEAVLGRMATMDGQASTSIGIRSAWDWGSPIQQTVTLPGAAE